MTKRPTEARREEAPGGRNSQRIATTGWLADLEQRHDLRAQLQAIIDELDRLDADVDVPRTIAEGALEDLDALLSGERVVSRPDSLHECLRDTVCRIIAVRESLEVGDHRLAAIVLADLEEDLAGLVAYLEAVAVAA